MFTFVVPWPPYIGFLVSLARYGSEAGSRLPLKIPDAGLHLLRASAQCLAGPFLSGGSAGSRIDTSGPASALWSVRRESPARPETDGSAGGAARVARNTLRTPSLILARILVLVSRTVLGARLAWRRPGAQSSGCREMVSAFYMFSTVALLVGALA